MGVGTISGGTYNLPPGGVAIGLQTVGVKLQIVATSALILIIGYM